MKMQIVAYDRGPLKISDTISREEINFDNVEIKISSLLKYNTSGGLLGAQLTIKYMMEGGEKEIAEIGMMFSVYIEGWNEFVQNDPSEDEILTFLKQDGLFFVNVLNAANAVVLERGIGTVLERFFVPCTMNMDEFIANAVRIMKNEE